MDARTRGRIGAYVRLARHGSNQATSKARAAFLEGFERAVDPDGRLTPEERADRASHALRAHMIRLAAMSAKSRKSRRRSA
jgi:hypothetical protein